MKKSIIVVLTVILTLTCVTACSNGANRFYNSKVLKEFQITDFPKPEGAKDLYAPTKTQLYFNTTAEGFEDYAHWFVSAILPAYSRQSATAANWLWQHILQQSNQPDRCQ